MSDGPSTQCRRITKTCFRTCSRCLSHSQAGFCLYTQRVVSKHAEPTIARLRYILGGDRPSQTTHHALSWWRIHSTQLDAKNDKGGISRVTPPNLAVRIRSLPPILHISISTSKQSCSKGARGLSVFLRLRSIFTSISNSLSPSLRQWGSRYAIRAGRNLPDKEFRYLRTVIVTAAVYRGFRSSLRLRLQLTLTFRHRAGVRPYTSSFEFAESCVFSKQSLPPALCNLPTLKPARGYHRERPTFSRSYGGNVLSSLTTVLSSALVFSTCPPVSVWGTDTMKHTEKLFLEAWDQSLRVGVATFTRHHLS